MIINYEMPFLPPSINTCYRSYGKRVVKSSKLKAYEQQVIQFFDSQDDEIIMIEGKLKLTVSFYLKGRRSIDLDNLLKALLDGLEGVLFENDKMVFQINSQKFNECSEPKTVITLEQIEELD